MSTGSPVQKVRSKSHLYNLDVKERILWNCILERAGFKWGLVRRTKYFGGENYPRIESWNVECESQQYQWVEHR